MKSIRLNESQVIDLVKDTIDRVLSEGALWEPDGRYRYQGTGSEASRDRVHRMRTKVNKGNYRDDNDKSLYDKNRNDLKKSELGYHSRNDEYNRYGNGNQEYKMLYNLSENLWDIFNEFRYNNEKVKFSPDAERILNELEKNIQSLKTSSKRDWDGTLRK